MLEGLAGEFVMRSNGGSDGDGIHRGLFKTSSYSVVSSSEGCFGSPGPGVAGSCRSRPSCPLLRFPGSYVQGLDPNSHSR